MAAGRVQAAGKTLDVASFYAQSKPIQGVRRPGGNIEALIEASRQALAGTKAMAERPCKGSWIDIDAEGNPGLEACLKTVTLARLVSIFFSFHRAFSSCLPIHSVAAPCPPLRC